jgi:hypothetical protein
MSTETAISRGHGERKLAVACLLQHPTVKAAAKAVGVGEQTLHRWLRDPIFAREVESARENVLTLASDELRAGTLEAVKTLREVTRNKKAPAGARVQACRVFLEATNLLKSLSTSVTVNNNNLPQDVEGLNTEILKMLGGMLRTDDKMRKAVERILAEEVENERPSIQ